jgi:hypothetical protein
MIKNILLAMAAIGSLGLQAVQAWNRDPLPDRHRKGQEAEYQYLQESTAQAHFNHVWCYYFIDRSLGTSNVKAMSCVYAPVSYGLSEGWMPSP